MDDLIEKYEKEIKDLTEKNIRMKEALEFYADAKNWRSPSSGFASQYDPEPAPMSRDCGRQARNALL